MLKGGKTYLFGVGSIVFAGLGMALGKIPYAEGFNIIQVALASMFLRNAVANK